MRYKATFIAGIAVGFIAGSRAGRGAYDTMMRYGQQIAGHPKVQQATSAAQAKGTGQARAAAMPGLPARTQPGRTGTTRRPARPGQPGQGSQARAPPGLVAGGRAGGQGAA